MIAASSMSIKRYLDERQSKPKILDIKQQEISEEEITQYTDLELGFELNGIKKHDKFYWFFFHSKEL